MMKMQPDKESVTSNELDKILILEPKKAVRMMTNTDHYPPIPGPRNPSNPSFVASFALEINLESV